MTKISTQKKNRKRDRTFIKGRLISTPAPIELRYRRELKKAVEDMTKAMSESVLAFFKRPKSREYFAQDENIASQLQFQINRKKAAISAQFFDSAKLASKRMIRSAHQEARRTVKRSFLEAGKEFAIPAPELPQGMAEVLKASLEENASLIKNIFDDYIAKISGDLMRVITTGDGNLTRLTTLIASCRKRAIHRAENVALDQTRKAFQAVARTQLTAAGVKKGIWIHAGGTLHPRREHQVFNGKTFDLNQGAPIGRYSGRNDMPTWPGFEPFCRCSFKPVLEWGD